VYLLAASNMGTRPDEIANLGSIVELMHILQKYDGTLILPAVKSAQKLNNSRGSKGPGLDLTGVDGQAVANRIIALREKAVLSSP
jgi:hypothetical protein